MEVSTGSPLSSLASCPAGSRGVDRRFRETVWRGAAEIELLLVMVSLLAVYSRFRLSNEIDIDLIVFEVFLKLSVNCRCMVLDMLILFKVISNKKS